MQYGRAMSEELTEIAIKDVISRFVNMNS